MRLSLSLLLRKENIPYLFVSLFFYKWYVLHLQIIRESPYGRATTEPWRPHEDEQFQVRFEAKLGAYYTKTSFRNVTDSVVLRMNRSDKQ